MIFKQMRESFLTSTSFKNEPATWPAVSTAWASFLTVLNAESPPNLPKNVAKLVSEIQIPSRSVPKAAPETQILSQNAP